MSPKVVAPPEGPPENFTTLLSKKGRALQARPYRQQYKALLKNPRLFRGPLPGVSEQGSRISLRIVS
jgi:hypothetical protein